MFSRTYSTISGTFTILITVLVAAITVTYIPVFAQFPGGFIETPATSTVRPALTAAQIQSFLPTTRDKFTFPAPYNTEGIRLTIPGDCGGADCVNYAGYSYWRNINNHVGNDMMLIFLGLDRIRGGVGPTLFSYNKATDVVTNLGALFDPASPYSWHSGEGWYFSATQPTKLYIYNNGTQLLRYDVLAKTFETVFDISAQFGTDKYIFQVHSSNDDRVHSFTLRQTVTWEMLGCAVYREDTRQFLYYPKIGAYDECQVDRGGHWLLIKEALNGIFTNGEDNRIINLDTGAERVQLATNGAVGHSDNGYGSALGVDVYSPLPNSVRLFDFAQDPLLAPVVFHNNDWSVMVPGHISYTDAQSALLPDQQYACASSTNRTNSWLANEIMCFRLDTSLNALVIAPVMTDLNALGGGDDYGKAPKGNLDVTGQYFIWTSNMGGSRLDAFIVKMPAQLLTSITPAPTPDTTPPVISAVTAPLITSSGATITWTTNEAGDSQVEYGPTTAYGSLTTLNTSLTTSHSQTLSGLAASTLYHYRVKSRDAAGNLAVSVDFTFATLAAVDATPPTVSITAPTSGSTVRGTIAVSAGASDNVGVVGVQFKLDGVNLGVEDTARPYSTSWNTKTTTNGSHILTAVARDAASNTTTSSAVLVQVKNPNATADTTPPTVSISSPLTGTTVTGAIPVSANASDNVGVAGVQFKLDGASLGTEDTTSPYSIVWNTATATNGSHTLTAVARDAAGNSTISAAVTVTVNNDTTPPTISLVSSSGVSSLEATILWTTNEAGDSQVEYGPTTAYGSLTTLNTSLTTSHSQTLSGLAASTLYHYRVKSRDAAGNLAVSADFTFTTAMMAASGLSVQNVIWRNMVNVTPNGNSLQKTSGCNGCDDAGATSQQQIASGNGYVEFTVGEINTFWVGGLSHDNSTNTTLADVDFGLRFNGAGGADVLENGVYKGGDTSYSPGDVFRVAVESGVVKYYKNGALLYTSTVAPVYPLLLDTSFASLGATVNNAVIAFPLAASVANVVWRNMVNVTATGNSLQKTSGCNGCDDAGATSQQQIASGNGYVEFTVGEINTFWVGGLSHDNSTNTTLADVDFGLRFNGAGGADVLENGVYKGGDTSYSPGDVFRVAVESGVVKYYKNGALLYTSTVAPVYPLLLDTSFASLGATVNNAVIFGSQ